MNPLIYSLPQQHLSRQALTDSFPMHVPFVPNSFPITVFWCFMGVEKRCIGNKWVKIGQFFLSYIPWKSSYINSFSTNIPLLYLMETSENRRFSVFRGYISGTLVENGLTMISCNHRHISQTISFILFQTGNSLFHGNLS